MIKHRYMMVLEKETALVAVAVIVTQSLFAGYMLLTKVAFDAGMNIFVFTFYRQALATLSLAPFAIFFGRKKAPRLSFSIFIEIFVLCFIGITVSANSMGVALIYTSASLGAASANSVPVITFFLAVLLRMEKLNIRTGPGMMKAAGVSLCIGGVATIAFYHGPSFKLLGHAIRGNLVLDHPRGTWVKGVFLMLLSDATWSCWLTLQGRMLKIYPSKLLLTTWQCFLSAIQTGAVAVAFARDASEWKLGWDLRLVTVCYCGIIVVGVSYYLQAWLIEKKGPVFLAMTTPLVLVLTIILSAFIFGEAIVLGRALGAILLVGGLYFVLWGKTKEEQQTANDECQQQPSDHDAENGNVDVKPNKEFSNQLG